MKKRIMSLKNSDGHALVLGVILLLFFIMLYYVIFAYAEYRSTAIFVQTTAESTLDEYTAEQGRIKAASIKNGTDYTVVLDKGKYMIMLQKNLGIDARLSAHRNGLAAFRLAHIALQYRVDKRINSKVSFDLTLPFYWGKTEVSSLTKNISVTSKYNVIE